MRTIAISIACLSLILVAAQDDFEETRDGYEFIYHKSHNLLLTIHDNKCYFALVKEDSSHPWNLTDHKQEVENYMKSLIEKNRGSNIQPASLEDARKEFNDLLADFHCLDKYVYLMELDLKTVHDEHGHSILQLGGELLRGAASASVVAGDRLYNLLHPFHWIG